MDNPIKKVFLHYLDNAVIDQYELTKRYKEEKIIDDFILATRIAFLLVEEYLIIPNSFYFENKIAYEVINKLKEIFNVDLIRFSGKEPDPYDYLEKKRVQFSNKKDKYPGYYSKKIFRKYLDLEASLLIRRKYFNIGESTSAKWIEDIEKNEKEWITNIIIKNGNIDLIKELIELPLKLEDKPVLWDFLIDCIPSPISYKNSKFFIQDKINSFYAELYLNEYDAYIIGDFPKYDLRIGINKFEYKTISLSKIIRRLRRYGIYDIIKNSLLDRLIKLKFTIGGSWLLVEQNPKHLQVLIDCINEIIKRGVIPKKCYLLAYGFEKIKEKTYKEKRTMKIDIFKALIEAFIVAVGPAAAPVKFLSEIRDQLKQQEQHNVDLSIVAINETIVKENKLNLNREEILWIEKLIQPLISADMIIDEDSIKRAIIKVSENTYEYVFSNYRLILGKLSEYYPDRRDIITLIRKIGINEGQIELEGSSEYIWSNLLKYLKGNDKIITLLLLLEVSSQKSGENAFTKPFNRFKKLDN